MTNLTADIASTLDHTATRVRGFAPEIASELDGLALVVEFNATTDREAVAILNGAIERLRSATVNPGTRHAMANRVERILRGCVDAANAGEYTEFHHALRAGDFDA